ncbi:hypothetical protein GMMP15_1110019 [Candidatus Magnetomoraceae bacterium gMMP-15]
MSSYAAVTGKIVNIPNVYETKEDFDFTGPRNYDAATGYNSKSMLVIPMKNHENDIIGVLQLLNAQDRDTQEVIPFSSDYIDMVASLASQAAIALTNAQLIQNLKKLFYSFIQSIATAIDEKSPYTGGHIRRVVELTMMIAEKINVTKDGPFKDIHFTKDEMEEMRIAAWMHDVGKIVTPEHVLDKGTRLDAIINRIHLIETRFRFIERSIENAHLKRKIELLENRKDSEAELKQIDNELTEHLKTCHEELEFIKSCNIIGFMSDENIDKIKEIAAKTYYMADEKHPYLTEDEVKNLCIRKGTLTIEERLIVEHHATMTFKMLNQLPFPKNLSKVPEYASGHHEKLDGSGYPRGLSEDELPWQTRIMAVADIFEALTAKDRPYRQPMKLSQAIKILGFMKKDRHIDPDVYDLLIEKELYRKYIKKELDIEE